MLDIGDVVKGSYKLRSIANRDNGDRDYSIDNFAMPLTLELGRQLNFKKVSSILVRLGNTSMFSLHLLLDRDLHSQIMHLDLDAKDTYLEFYKSGSGKMYLKILDR